MEMKKEKSELEQISDFMDYMVYTVFTKDNIELECELRREQESASLIFRWEWTVNWVMSKPRWDFAWSKHTLWLTDKWDLEFCISQMNDYIKDNFKTKLG